MSLMLLGGDGHFKTFSVVACTRTQISRFIVIGMSSIVMKFAKKVLV